jgi:hypothetical protein
MCRKSLVMLALFLIVALPAPGQRSESYFSLTTTKTFLPGEKIGVRLYSRGVSALEFRVYRVNDPLQFFEQLGDVHNFNSGGLGQREKVETPTPLERFHDWKRNYLVLSPRFCPSAILRAVPLADTGDGHRSAQECSSERSGFRPGSSSQ